MEDKLLFLGFSKNESKVYLALANLGESTGGEIAKHAKIHRTNCYDALNNLISKGLISFIEKDGKKFYLQGNPDSLFSLLKEKEEQVKQILPQLHMLKNHNDKEHTAEVLEGLPAFKRVMDNFLSYNSKICALGGGSQIADLIGPFLNNFHNRRIEKKIVMSHIYSNDADKRMEYLSNLPFTPLKVLPAEYDSPITTLIVGDEVVFTLWSKNALTIRIKSKKLANSYFKYYELLWSKAKPYVSKKKS